MCNKARFNKVRFNKSKSNKVRSNKVKCNKVKCNNVLIIPCQSTRPTAPRDATLRGGSEQPSHGTVGCDFKRGWCRAPVPS